MGYLFGLSLRYLAIFSMVAFAVWYGLNGYSLSEIFRLGFFVMIATAALPALYTGGYYVRRAKRMPGRVEALLTCFTLVSFSIFLLFGVLFYSGALEDMMIASVSVLGNAALFILVAYVGMTWMFFRMGAWVYLKMAYKQEA